MKTHKSYWSSGKKLLALFIAVVIIFVGVSLFWTVSVYIPYCEYLSVVEEKEYNEKYLGVYYAKSIDGRRYQVNAPSFMEFKGLLVVFDEEKTFTVTNETGEVEYINSEMHVGLRIITKPFGNHDYVATFSWEEKGIDKWIFIDENMNLEVNDYDDIDEIEEAKKLIYEYRNELEEILNTARNLWKL